MFEMEILQMHQFDSNLIQQLMSFIDMPQGAYVRTCNANNFVYGFQSTFANIYNQQKIYQ